MYGEEFQEHQLVFQKDNQLITVYKDEAGGQGFWLVYDEQGPRFGVYNENLVEKTGK